MPRPSSNKASTAPLSTAAAGPATETARGSNVPEVTVSELSTALKRTVEDRFGFVRLRGEISNYRGPHGSGHAYFSLKDEGARIDAVVWKTTLARMRVRPEEGLEVIASGKITTFPGKSSYQIVVETLEPAGVGALMAVLEQRRQMLAAEGLFDAARKKPLPFLPAVIGVVTSPTGAVIRDILHRVGARFPRHVLVWPVRVQGETSGSEVAAAIRGFNALADDHAVRRPHVIIVARGGGSLEDLWGFNDEAVVRAAAASLIPLISAVGHETDWTLIDHAADLRAPTPTGAAEMALPVLVDLEQAIDRLRARGNGATLRRLERAQTGLRALVRVLPSALDLLAGPQQRFDRAAGQLPGATRVALDRARLKLARLSNRLAAESPQARMGRAEQRLIAVGDRLGRARSVDADRRRTRLVTDGIRLAAAFSSRIRLLRLRQDHERTRLAAVAVRLERASDLPVRRAGDRLGNLGRQLASLSYRSVLARGYAILHAPDGTALRSVGDAQVLGRFAVELADGRFDAEVVPAGDRDTSPPTRPKAGRRRMGGDPVAPPQGSLFDP